jgi:HAD superfamily hydrolase (TIGR01509 family)
MSLQKSEPRVLLFDFVGVLLRRQEACSTDPLVEAVDTLIGGVTDDEDFGSTVRRQYHLEDAQFRQVLQTVADRYVPFEPLWALLPGLRARYRLAVINNGTMLTFPFFDARLSIGENFEAFLCSGREGVRKPDARIYLAACESLGVSAGDCLFMDDSLENVHAAQQLGMRGIHWPDYTQGFDAFTRQVRP